MWGWRIFASPYFFEVRYSMDDFVGIYLLSQKFMQAYPLSLYPELMYKQGRPYTCLLIQTHEGYLICVPFRSSIHHKNAFLFKHSARSEKSQSGLDYSKIILIQDEEYLDSSKNALVDQDEYREMRTSLPKIVKQVDLYIRRYKDHVIGAKPLHKREYERNYQYSTLPYFHDILGI